MHLGIDLDNTIIDYRETVRAVALEMGYVEPDVPADKTAVRDRIRRLPDGDLKWQEVQAEIYGPGISDADPFPGAKAFLRVCATQGIPVDIVSHKTRYANRDTTETSLRDAALRWLHREGLLDETTGLAEADVHFRSTRQEKIATIRKLGCTRFIDDLVETFREPAFPDEVDRVLFSPGPSEDISGIEVVESWDAARERLDAWR